MAKARNRRTTRGESLDVDALYLRAGYKPPRINVRTAIDKAIKGGKGRISDFSYNSAAQILGLKNSNNIAKWLKNENLNFNTLKMIMFVLDCPIEDLIEPPKKIRARKELRRKFADKKNRKKK